ncbi:uncharacterized protein [Diadema setosum]|uniref:uncharacterized protein n=1 Tax=Diadema setosum TaxID=31175 RepID=UPI003B3B6AC6
MESLLRFACLVAGLLAVQAQCPPSWQKVENSCYRVFGQSMSFDMASQMCKSFVGCDGISPGHLACPSSYQEQRFVRKLRFEILRPLRGFQMGEGQRLRPQTVWLGLRLGQGANTTWESTEMYDNAAMAQHWGANRPGMAARFDPTEMRWNGRCAVLPGQMQMNGAMQKWGHQACNMRFPFICEISAPGISSGNGTFGADGGFNATTGFGPQQPANPPQWPGTGGGAGAGRGQGGGGGRVPGAGAGAGTGGRFPPNTPGNTPRWPTRPNTPPNPRGPGGPRPRLYQQAYAQP